MIARARLRRDERGVAATEFALMVPLLVAIIVGIAQMGKLYFSHAGLRNLVAEGARFASISPRPSDEDIKTRIRAGGFGLESSAISEPAITYGATSDGANYAQITVTYTLQLDYLFWRPAPTLLTETRRVFIYPPPT